jgi:hypothetical protein
MSIRYVRILISLHLMRLYALHGYGGAKGSFPKPPLNKKGNNI